MNPTQLAAAVAAKQEALRISLDTDVRKAELAEVMKDFARGGKYFYAPKREKELAQARKIADMNHATGVLLYELGHLLSEAESAVGAVMRELEAPLTNEQAFCIRGNVGGINAETGLLIGIQAELLRARIAAELDRSQPSARKARYEAALSDPTDQESATVIRLIEAAGRDAWNGPAVDVKAKPEEGAALLQLRRRINEVREGRVPADVKEAAATIAAARTYETHTRSVRQVLHLGGPVNPRLTPPPPADDLTIEERE